MLTQQPLGNRVLLKRKLIERTEGGIIVPKKKNGEMTANVGEIVALGPDVSESLSAVLEPGTLVTFGRYAPLSIDPWDMKLYGVKDEGGDEYEMLLINADDLLEMLLDDAPPQEPAEAVE